jgi:hypothetical protein
MSECTFKYIIIRSVYGTIYSTRRVKHSWKQIFGMWLPCDILVCLLHFHLLQRALRRTLNGLKCVFCKNNEGWIPVWVASLIFPCTYSSPVIQSNSPTASDRGGGGVGGWGEVEQSDYVYRSGCVRFANKNYVRFGLLVYISFLWGRSRELYTCCWIRNTTVHTIHCVQVCCTRISKSSHVGFTVLLCIM